MNDCKIYLFFTSSPVSDSSSGYPVRVHNSDLLVLEYITSTVLGALNISGYKVKVSDKKKMKRLEVDVFIQHHADILFFNALNSFRKKKKFISPIHSPQFSLQFH